MPIIEVEHLTKEYRLGAMQGLKQALRNAAARLTDRTVTERPLFKALDDVSFSIEPGEVVGIIGHNGAGKSTLLKILAGISKPTAGRMRVEGRIAPLIEVGAGFVPDFTGRENVYLNGSIMGLPRREIDRKFDEIVDFAEMAEFIDTPVKRYSSGMQVKLAFAVATSIASEILIVDEVLAVGDLAFQRKCFDRMEDLIKRQGRTVLLVSHNIRQVERICHRVLLMDHGHVAADGLPSEICTRFYSENDEKIKRQSAHAARAREQTTGDVENARVELIDDAGNVTDRLHFGESARIRLSFDTRIPLVNPTFGIGIHTTDFLYLATENTHERFQGMTLPVGHHTLEMTIPVFPFLPGAYSVRVGINSGELSHVRYYAESLATFRVLIPGQRIRGNMKEGFVSLAPQWALY
ncbi:MAG TPA: ABC transporter ATP-binding protein [Thiobacillaceae bacterium]|nr:ABC transporter ATP-binding protein [Thiobacillaceae bacterium]HNU64282.1 ABC transporter ATP-binding protein [Thiobacillaceae bacterium]